MSKVFTYGSLLGLSTVSAYKIMTSRVFDTYAEIYEPPLTSIILCTLNEEGFIARALESLENQNVRTCHPDRFELIVVDSHSEDRTVEIAKEYADRVIQAPRGKLTSRNIGIREAKGEVIVAVDADCHYGFNWLNLILRHFHNPRVVAVAAPRLVDPEEGVGWTALSVWFSFVDLGLLGGMRIPGQSSAFLRQAYYDVGGFNLNINQTDVHEMVREEEIGFAARLRRVGLLTVDWLAPAFTSARRMMFVGKGREKYRKFVTERLSGERF